MRIFLFILFSPVFAYANVVVDIDTLYAVSYIDSDEVEVDNIYRIEIINNTESDRLFFISPQQCEYKSANEKFSNLLRQDIGEGWKMKHIIYEGNMEYNSKSYSTKSLLKIIPSGETFVVLVLNNTSLEDILDRIVTIKMEDVRTILKTDLRKDFIYPYSEVVWPYH